MKVRDAIARADALRPNCISDEEKVAALRTLEQEYAELMGVELPANRWPEDQELLMPEPHAISYVWHLCAEIDLANAEAELYANDKVTALSKVADASAWWRRHNTPVYGGNWRAV